MAEKEIIEIPGLSEGMRVAGIPLSTCVRANGFLYLSGMPPLDLKTGTVLKDLDLVAQTRQCLLGIEHVLKHAGSSLDKIVSMRVYCSEPTQFNVINDVYREFFPENPPARTFVPVVSWQMGFGVELECVALA